MANGYGCLILEQTSEIYELIKKNKFYWQIYQCMCYCILPTTIADVWTIDMKLGK